MNVYTAIAERRSIRKYKDTVIPKEVIEELIKSATLAPSARNRQPWKFIVVTGGCKEQLNKIIQLEIDRASEVTSDEYIKAAYNTIENIRQVPVAIVVLNVYGKSPWTPINNEGEYIEEICSTLSVGAAIENLVLRARELGLATLWITDMLYVHKELQKLLDTEYQIASIVAVGYSNEKPKPIYRKNIDEVVEYRD